MNFDLTEEQRRIRETLTDFAEREIKPHSTKWDKEQSFPRHIVEQLGQLGFLGVAFPEKFGGGGADTLSQVLVVEGLSRYDASIGLTCAAHMSLSTGHIAGFASDALRDHYVPDMLAAKKLGAWCLTEPSSGSDAAAMHTRATRVGDNYSITGSKMFITNGTVADVYVVIAITDQARGRDGVSAFIVDRSPSFSIFFPFESPAVPRSTMNADTPSRPRAWSVIAITTYTSATVPLVINILEPVIE